MSYYDPIILTTLDYVFNKKYENQLKTNDLSTDIRMLFKVLLSYQDESHRRISQDSREHMIELIHTYTDEELKRLNADGIVQCMILVLMMHIQKSTSGYHSQDDLDKPSVSHMFNKFLIMCRLEFSNEENVDQLLLIVVLSDYMEALHRYVCTVRYPINNLRIGLRCTKIIRYFVLEYYSLDMNVTAQLHELIFSSDSVDAEHVLTALEEWVHLDIDEPDKSNILNFIGSFIDLKHYRSNISWDFQISMKSWGLNNGCIHFDIIRRLNALALKHVTKNDSLYDVQTKFLIDITTYTYELAFIEISRVISNDMNNLQCLQSITFKDRLDHIYDRNNMQNMINDLSTATRIYKNNFGATSFPIYFHFESGFKYLGTHVYNLLLCCEKTLPDACIKIFFTALDQSSESVIQELSCILPVKQMITKRLQRTYRIEFIFRLLNDKKESELLVFQPKDKISNFLKDDRKTHLLDTVRDLMKELNVDVLIKVNESI